MQDASAQRTSTGTVVTFEDSLERLEVGWAHASPDGLADVLEEHCPEPAVGVEFPYDDVDLLDWTNTDPIPANLRGANAGVTVAGLGITDYGSAIVQGMPGGIKPASLLGDLRIAALRWSDTVPGVPEAFDWLGEEFRTGHSPAIIATGPSATADMGALVKGAHGPKDVHVVILDE